MEALRAMEERAGWTPRELRRLAVRVAGEAAARLRDLACTEGLERIIRGDTAVVDLDSEEYIKETLRLEGFKGTIIGEETGVTKGEEPIIALVDPLDGSKNYLSCIPWSSVSIAFATPSGELLAGAVAPVFYGAPFSFDDQGCYEGGARLEPRKPPLYKVLLTYVEKPEAAEKVRRIVEALGPGVKVRSMGSAALEISLVAAGRALAFADLRSQLRNIDIAAATGITRKCGGEVIGSDGSPLRIPLDRVVRVGDVIASHDGRIAQLIVKVL